ncbi:hypothetical protein LTR48_001761 [Friedmanniomyces endolithicus]|uniref:Uncharacterized protein n=1 Tax=Rachicladosporium monterosium TaxID=1507873 RepID=A0ABR0LD66_9PEZI|nr:hypothetical protein LTR29_015446 [Friedmanniomyces endolithicus]KAK1088245.1 hypothetical protein LTR48_001761 [Friedmanniomyces endolithicus]KAK1809560.1 hypothetical protein LTR12_016064 [Friedmanniomyces endolithicus]KAK5146977.1 hypothetical protein LTR32_001516 [Rachicladosporium monterosium]
MADPPPLSEEDSRQEGGECMFFRLAAELRNYIYELAFNEYSEVSIALLSAAPPSKAMVLTCRQAYNEAAAIYRVAYRLFWTTNHFELKVNYNTRLGETQAACWSKPPPPQLPSGGLALDWVITRLEEVSPDVHNLRISDCPGMSDSINWDLLPSSGGWRTSSDNRSQWCIPIDAHVYRSGQTVVVCWGEDREEPRLSIREQILGIVSKLY